MNVLTLLELSSSCSVWLVCSFGLFGPVCPFALYLDHHVRVSSYFPASIDRSIERPCFVHFGNPPVKESSSEGILHSVDSTVMLRSLCR